MTRCLMRSARWSIVSNGFCRPSRVPWWKCRSWVTCRLVLSANSRPGRWERIRNINKQGLGTHRDKEREFKIKDRTVRMFCGAGTSRNKGGGGGLHQNPIPSGAFVVKWLPVLLQSHESSMKGGLESPLHSAEASVLFWCDLVFS